MRSYGCVRVSHPLRPCDRVGHTATFRVFGGFFCCLDAQNGLTFTGPARDPRAFERYRGRCGRPPARHDRSRCACRHRAAHREPVGCRLGYLIDPTASGHGRSMGKAPWASIPPPHPMHADSSLPIRYSAGCRLSPTISRNNKEELNEDAHESTCNRSPGGRCHDRKCPTIRKPHSAVRSNGRRRAASRRDVMVPSASFASRRSTSTWLSK
jgi:hypothetical protein